jgi:hypothetical protein
MSLNSLFEDTYYRVKHFYTKSHKKHLLLLNSDHIDFPNQKF